MGAVCNQTNRSLSCGQEIEKQVEGHKLYLRKEITTGSSGNSEKNHPKVYEGTKDGREVTVKCFVLASSDVAKNEADLLKVLDSHPNIIHLYGVLQSRDCFYLLLEHSCCSLYDLVLYTKPLDWWTPHRYPSSVLLKLLRGIVNGLAHMHSHGYVHRNLKPHNVLLVVIGEDLCPKLSDMGSSRCLAEAESFSIPNATASGSQGWRSPRKIPHGPEHFSTRSQTQAMDMFSLGCLFYFCLTDGKHPFGSSDKREKNVARNQVDLHSVEYCPEAKNLISQLLNPVPEQRPKALEVLSHPFFWDSEKRINFITETSDWVEWSLKRGGCSVLDELENIGLVAFSGRWDVKMEIPYISEMEGNKKNRRYNHWSVRDLLCTIRNTKCRHLELSAGIQRLLGGMPEGVDNYYRCRFPKLLMEVYNVMHRHCKQDAWFRKHLRN